MFLFPMINKRNHCSKNITPEALCTLLSLMAIKSLLEVLTDRTEFLSFSNNESIRSKFLHPSGGLNTYPVFFSGANQIMSHHNANSISSLMNNNLACINGMNRELWNFIKMRREMWNTDIFCKTLWFKFNLVFIRGENKKDVLLNFPLLLNLPVYQ